MSRKNFNYHEASVSAIAEHFKHSSSQLIYAMRKNYKGDEAMSAKIEQAYKMHKIAKLQESFEV